MRPRTASGGAALAGSVEELYAGRRGDRLKMTPEEANLLVVGREDSRSQAVLLLFFEFESTEEVCNRLRFLRVGVARFILGWPDFFETLFPFLLAPWEIDPDDGSARDLKF